MKLFVLLSCGLAAASALEKPPIKQFELDITWSKRAVDGVDREQVLVNGQFPGPALIFDEGDDVEVTVNNFLPFNTTVHYHGIVQQGTPWSDGVPGVSQRLIAPGKQFVHKFNAMQYGTYWYHSHSRGQNMDGLYGPIYIRPRNVDASLLNTISNDSAARNQMQKAIQDPNLLMLSDWFHNTSEELRQIALAANLDTICADSILINGKGRVRCVDPEYLTSLIPPQISPLLQGKNLTDKGCLSTHNTYAQTATPQHYNEIPLPFLTNAKPQTRQTKRSKSILKMAGGTRYSVLVQLNNQPGDYRITAASAGFNQKIAGYGTFSYVNGDPSVVGTSSLNYGGVPSTDAVVLDGLTVEPLIPDQPTGEPESTYLLTIGRFEKAWKWSLNGDNAYDLSLEKDRPLLWDPQSQKDSNLVIATKNGTWVDIIFEVAGNKTTLQPGHPIHKHSNMLYVIGSGLGKFNWTTVAEAKEEIPESFNLVNPPMRDTFTTLPAFQGPSWMAIRYHVVNPGAFMLHCHIDPHLTGGMMLAILDGIDAWPEIPAHYGPDGHWGKATEQ
ncbi:Multicopper oxidase type 2 [Penicillium brevicompactum]|uniref:Multicopper oxidase type 2 n=1 Tax=Penicillium brevicompactum TaxID=5074 RepID=A0A9W9RYF7_PENBR|nr:Multicopper oxidase type 2 [Penicillium brevicompactum]